MSTSAKTGGVWKFVVGNVLTIVTIITAVAALVLSRLGFIEEDLLPSFIIGLLALIATTQLIDNRRSLFRLSNQLIDLEEKVTSLEVGYRVKKFVTTESALTYLAERTSSARESIDQASLDKQRARNSPARLFYESARKQLIHSDRITYRYLGVTEDQSRILAVKKVMNERVLYKFFAAFRKNPPEGLSLMSFTIFDKEEVFARAPYSIGENPIYISIRCPELATVFEGYFDNLWRKSDKVEGINDIEGNGTKLSS